MASSNRHWPSMFKSKPCPQPWHDINSNTPPLLSTLAQKSGCEERSPEPKPRWNPRPEQIRILEAIFNSGMVNPPREEIHKIRLQLQQYGQVGDANVFYWFQNRKSRTKNKHRQQLSTRTNSRLSTGTNISNPNPNSNTSIVNVNIGVINTGINVTAHNNTNSMASPSTPITVPITMTAPTSSSSSSSERSSGSSKPLKPVHAPMSILDPVNHIYNHNVHGSVDFSNASDQPSFFFQNPHGYCFSIPELTGSTLISAPEQLSGLGLGLWSEPAMGSTSIVATSEEEEGGKFKNDGLGLWNDLVSQEAGCKGFVQGENGEHKVKIGLHHECSFELTNPVVTSNVAESVITASVPAATTVTTASLVSEIQGFGNGGGRSNGVGGEARLTVFINDVAFDVPDTRLNVKAVFGLNAMLVHASGYPVPIDESANTLYPLQHAAAYYVV